MNIRILACRPAAVLVAALSLAACSSDELTRTFGLTRDAPDEFRVTTRAPLSMPPDMSIRPPRPGAPRPQEQTQQQAAQAALVPETVLAQNAAAPPSSGQQALLSAAGRPAPANIRAQIDNEPALDTPTQTLTDRLMFWKSPPPPGTAVDPEREAARLRQNAALGQSQTAGDTPIIQRKRQGLLQSIF